MALPKGYKWRQGDRVRLTGTIDRDYEPNDGDVYVNIDASVYDDTVRAYSNPKDNPDGIELIEAPIGIGDMVLDTVGGVSGKVVALHESWAWVKLALSGNPVGVRLSDLERVYEAEPQKEAA